MFKRKAHEAMEKATYLWFLKILAEQFLCQDRSLLRTHCNSTAGFMARSLQTISRLVKCGYMIKSMEQRPAASSFQVKSLKVKRVVSCYQLNLKHAGFSSDDEADVQEWLTVDRHKPGYTVMTEEEIVQAVGRPDKEDDELIADERAVPSHNEAYACLSTCVWWL